MLHLLLAVYIFHIIRKLVDNDLSWHSLGCGGDDPPTLQVPAAPVYPKAEDLFTKATNFGKMTTPNAYGAREQALSDINNPAYYAGFQPTSFENALSNQYFQNVWPDVKRQTLQGLSLAGIESSPVTGELLGKQYGNIAMTIGEYLANLGNTRATNSLNARINIDPSSTYTNYLNTDLGQSNNQVNANYENALLQAQNNYQNALRQYQQQQAGIGGAFGLGGAGIGALIAGLTAVPTGGMSLAALPSILGAGVGGAGIGSSLGGMLTPLAGGSSGGGMGIGDALSLAKYLNLGKTGRTQKVNSGTSNISNNPFNISSILSPDSSDLLSLFSGGYSWPTG